MCIFCKYLEQKEEIIFENETAFAIYDEFPVNKGHMLIMPKRHVASFFNLTTTEKEDIDSLIVKSKKHVDEVYQPSGYNVGVNDGVYAGQSVMHCHIHLIPRYKGDMLDPKGGVRGVIPNKQKY